MPTFGKHVIAAGIVGAVLASTGVAAAGVPSSHGPRTNPALRTFPACPSAIYT